MGKSVKCVLRRFVGGRETTVAQSVEIDTLKEKKTVQTIMAVRLTALSFATVRRLISAENADGILKK